MFGFGSISVSILELMSEGAAVDSGGVKELASRLTVFLFARRGKGTGLSLKDVSSSILGRMERKWLFLLTKCWQRSAPHSTLVDLNGYCNKKI